MGRGCGDEECRGDVPPRGTAVWPPFAHGRLWDGELLSVISALRACGRQLCSLLRERPRRKKALGFAVISDICSTMAAKCLGDNQQHRGHCQPRSPHRLSLLTPPN